VTSLWDCVPSLLFEVMLRRELDGGMLLAGLRWGAVASFCDGASCGCSVRGGSRGESLGGAAESARGGEKAM
jgi:hypothetical protein